MPSSPVLEFIADNPFLAFFLAWPVALVLIAVAWCATTLITNTFATFFALVGQFFALILTLFRGYPPKDPAGLKRDSVYDRIMKEDDEALSKEDNRN